MFWVGTCSLLRCTIYVSHLSPTKIAERAAQVQLQEFFLNTGQLNCAAHAYKAAYSTTTTIASITDEIYEAAEDKRIAQIMTIDQTAAFDSISHDILNRKLELYGVGENARKWIRSYLTYR